MIKKISLLLLALVLGIGANFAQAPAGLPNFTIKGEGSSGSAVMVKVSINNKKKDKVTDTDLAKCAVYGVLFRGFTDSSVQGFGGSTDYPALMDDPSAFEAHRDFFEPFFDNGDYQAYVQPVDDSYRVVKVGKEYKISNIFSVNRASLQKYLEKKGIKKGLNSGW